MIYGQLKTVPRWNMGVTPVLFLLYALAGGALLATQLRLALFLLIALTVTQILTWLRGDMSFAAAGHSIETATGLGHLGKVRLLESPHSGENYLTREMVHIIGRKHGLKLRIIATICLGLIPIAMLAFFNLSHISALLVIILHITGLFVARWLFFAEAEHVVGVYYDKR
jgi:DMSO reductase anchor subunit